MPKKYIAQLDVSYYKYDSAMCDKINNYLKKHYKNKYEDGGYSVGGGTVDLTFVFKDAVTSKQAFAKLISPFMNKFSILDPSITYIDEKEILEEQEAEKKDKARQKKLKADLHKVHAELRKKYAGDEDSLKELREIFS